jgi:hypothetical protein
VSTPHTLAPMNNPTGTHVPMNGAPVTPTGNGMSPQMTPKHMGGGGVSMTHMARGHSGIGLNSLGGHPGMGVGANHMGNPMGNPGILWAARRPQHTMRLVV